jgi:hypothetical protein
MLARYMYLLLVGPMLFGFVGCTDKEEPVVAVSHLGTQEDIDGILFVDDEIHISDGGKTVKIMPGVEEDEIVFTYGEFHISSNIGTMTLSEWNATDRLTVQMDFMADNHLIETYNLNGHVMTVEHDGKPNKEALPEFVEYYERHQTTLSDDSDGWILNSVLEARQDELIAAFEQDQQRYTQDPDKRRPTWATIICAIAMLCGGIKCWFGAILNPWCVGCSGAVLGCAIIEWFNWW